MIRLGLALLTLTASTLPSAASAQGFTVTKLREVLGVYDSNDMPVYGIIGGQASMSGSGRIEAFYFSNDLASPGYTHNEYYHLYYKFRPNNSSSWTSQYISTGFGPTSVYDEPGYRNVYFRRKTGIFSRMALWQAWQAHGSNTWNLEHVDGAKFGANGEFGGNVSAALSAVAYNGTGHMFYVGDECACLRHVWWDVGTNQWRYEVLDGENYDNGRIDANFSGAANAVSAVVDGNQIHVVYVNAQNNSIRRALYNGTGWSFETIAGGLYLLSAPVSAVVRNGELNVFCHDKVNRDVIHVYRRPEGWAEYPLDGTGNAHGPAPESLTTTNKVGQSTISSVVQNGTIYVSYNMTEATNNWNYLRIATVNLSPASTTFQTVSNVGPSIKDFSTFIDGAGRLNVTAITTGTGYTPGFGSTYDSYLWNALRCGGTQPPCPF